MKRDPGNVDVKNLCSRKLYELCATTAVDTSALAACIEELQTRQHYLEQLARLSESAQLPAHLTLRH